MQNPKVKLTAYHNYLIIETVPPFDKSDEFIPNGNGKLGCIIANTKTNLGISPEALMLLKQIKQSCDDIGDVMWWKDLNEKCYFGWLGGPYSIKHIDICDGDRSYQVFENQFIEILNESSQ